MEWQRDLKDPTEFIETVKIDLFQDEVFVFTPKGDVKALPKGSTPIDLAYADPLAGRRALLGRAGERPHRAAALRAAQRRHRRDPRLGQPEAVEGLAQVRRHQPRQDQDPPLHPDGAARAQPPDGARPARRASCASRTRRSPRAEREGLLDAAAHAAARSAPPTICWSRSATARSAPSTPPTPCCPTGAATGGAAPRRRPPRPRPPRAAPIAQALDRRHPGAGRGRHPGQVRQVLHARCRATPSSASSAAATAWSSTPATAPRRWTSIPLRRVDVAWDDESKTLRPVAVQVTCADRPGLLASISEVVHRARGQHLAGQVPHHRGRPRREHLPGHGRPPRPAQDRAAQPAGHRRAWSRDSRRLTAALPARSARAMASNTRKTWKRRVRKHVNMGKKRKAIESKRSTPSGRGAVRRARRARQGLAAASRRRRGRGHGVGRSAGAGESAGTSTGAVY